MGDVFFLSGGFQMAVEKESVEIIIMKRWDLVVNIMEVDDKKGVGMA